MNLIPSDTELLQSYAVSDGDADLTVLVHRYVDLVYSAARRQLGDSHLAQDVTQQVFIVLFRKGRQLRADTVLASWLLKVTALECRNLQRTEIRRARRERKVAQMTSDVQQQAEGSSHDDSGNCSWDDVAPHIDAALDELSAGDREAVVMRYFLNRSYEEAAALLGASEGSVRQRVHRGLGKIRQILGARGVIATETALSGALLAHAVTTAPAAVSAATVAAVGHAAVAQAAISKGVFTIMSVSTPAKVAVAVLLILAVSLTAFLLNTRGDTGHAMAGGAAAATNPASMPATLPVAHIADTTGPAIAAAAQPDVKPAAPVVPRKLFDVITARTCNNRQGPRDGFDHIAFINRGDWVEYDDVEFPPADKPRAMAFCAVVACPAQFAGHDIQVHLGAPDGPKIATLTVEATAGYGDFVCQQTFIETPLGGAQDVFLVFTGGGFNLRSIKFAVIDGRPADKTINATGYVMAKKVNEGAGALVQIRDGAWARYDCLQFPAEGADTFTLNYAVDAGHASGTISVRLGLPTSEPICEIPILNTGGYGRYYSRTVALKKLITGKQDVYLTLKGENRGYLGLADLASFKFNAPGTAALSGPPPLPATRRAATVPTTSPVLELWRNLSIER